jgi:hypothetical protein
MKYLYIPPNSGYQSLEPSNEENRNFGIVSKKKALLNSELIHTRLVKISIAPTSNINRYFQKKVMHSQD